MSHLLLLLMTSPHEPDRYRTSNHRRRAHPMTPMFSRHLRVRNVLLGRLASLNETPFEAGSDSDGAAAWIHWQSLDGCWRSLFLIDGRLKLTWRMEPEPRAFEQYKERPQCVELALQEGLVVALRPYLSDLGIRV
jgi:hypothetical protein